jgi:alkaline phosphatase D
MLRIQLSFIFLILIGKISGQAIFCPEIESHLKTLNKKFPFGVASGDPRENSIVLWTSIYPSDKMDEFEVAYQVSEDSLFYSISAEGLLKAEKSNAYCINVQAVGLIEGKKYFYRFRFENDYSPIGRTYTANSNSSELKFGVVSCSNYEWGYFNAYGALAKEKDLQAIIHLGDYIYEYQPGKYGNQKLSRKHLPSKEIITEEDYRSRYAQYRLDPDLQELHRLYPFISIWDDHEIANDTYKDGAQNHQPDEGPWEQRKNIAKKVYFEWLPIESSPHYQIRRKFQFGKMADLFMLDGRLEGRSKQVSGINDPIRYDSNRTMLGQEQAEWLIKEVSNSKAKWKIIGNQVIFSAFDYPSKLKTYSKSMDMWEGYPVERNRILNAWNNAGIQDIVILTGDVHASFSMELRRNIQDESSRMGAEWVTTSITSSNLNEYTSTWKVRVAEKWFREKNMNPHMNHIDLRNHGFLILELTENEATGYWNYVKTLTLKNQKIKKVVKRSLVHHEFRD